MSGKRRIVTIPVDDERATHARVQLTAWAGLDFIGHCGEITVPVPSDDQLTRKIDGVTKLAASKVAEYEAVGLPVPDWVIIQSCRYGFGRRSYALGMTCDHLRDIWASLPEDTRVVIRRDLEDAVEDAERYPGPGGDDYGLRVLLKLRDDLSKHDKDAA